MRSAMKAHYLTVEALFCYPTTNSDRPAPYLRLKGYWLADFGLKPGDHVRIQPTPAGLVIRKLNDQTIGFVH